MTSKKETHFGVSTSGTISRVGSSAVAGELLGSIVKADDTGYELVPENSMNLHMKLQFSQNESFLFRCHTFLKCILDGFYAYTY